MPAKGRVAEDRYPLMLTMIRSRKSVGSHATHIVNMHVIPRILQTLYAQQLGFAAYAAT